MSHLVDVEVRWVGPRLLPDTSRYITVSRFAEDYETWNKEAWSIVLEFPETPLKQGNPSRGKAYFLAPSAPVERLRPGRTFAMYEGKTKVADVKIFGKE